MKKIINILLAASVLVVTNASAEHRDKGVVAFEQGQYQTALRLLAAEAEQGSTQALYALGLMHEYGLGVDNSNSQAASYYFKGAQINTRQNRLAEARLFAIALERTAH